MKKIIISTILIFCLFAEPVSAAANTKSMDFDRAFAQSLSITDVSQTGLDITSDISIMTWVRPTMETGSEQYFIINKETTTNNSTRGYGARLLDGQVHFYYRDGSGNSTVKRTTNDVTNINTWYHVAITADVSAKDVKIYINGSSEAITSIAANATSINNNSQPFQIGVFSSTNHFDGQIDEIGVYNDILTPTEISNDYNSGNGTIRSASEDHIAGGWRFEDDLLDVTANNNDLTNNNSATFSTEIPFAGDVSALGDGFKITEF